MHSPVRALETSLFVYPMRTRLPFRYGIATVTELPHLFVRVVAEAGGRTAVGVASDHLAPKWFTKDPASTFAEDVSGMLRVIRHAARLATEAAPAPTAFDWWRGVYEAQAAWGRAEGLAPLLTGFGVSLVERALLDAVCRIEGRPFAALLRDGTLGFRPGDVHAELQGIDTADLLPSAPLPRIRVRHTVGLSDPLTLADLGPDSPDDGLPVALTDAVAAYGLRHFKLKVGGNIESDVARLEAITAALASAVPAGEPWAFSIDGNESFRTLESFRTFWDRVQASPALAAHLNAPGRLLFVEQPLHRDIALSPEAGKVFAAWPERPPVIIDESDAELSSLQTALSLGYAGTSHKNCKGVFKGAANACLLAHRRHAQPSTPALLSGEDLSNVGPVALGQDLAVQAALAIGSVERNGQHYFAGLSMFPAGVQEAALGAHPDLYRASLCGFPTLAIDGGYAELGSINAAPFGLGFVPEVAAFAEDVTAG